MTTEMPPSRMAHPPCCCAPGAFAMRFSSTPRGARLSRRLVSQRLDEWGYPYDTAVNDTVTLLAAELATNAVCHGHVPGHDFHLRLALVPAAVRIEVTDAHPGTVPTPRLPDGDVPGAIPEREGTSEPFTPDTCPEAGRGLVLVSLLAARWGVTPRPPGTPGKTVWAELRTA